MINWFDMPAEGLSNGGLFEVKELEVTENGTYEEKGEMYNKVVVNVEGGGGSWQTVFEGSVTTVKEGSFNVATIDANISSNTIKVSINNVVYTCEKLEDDSYGALFNEGDDTYDWSEYPFNIYYTGETWTIATETAGTYTLKIEEPQGGGSSDFSTAEVTISKGALGEQVDGIIPWLSEEDSLTYSIIELVDEETLTVKVPIGGDSITVYFSKSAMNTTGDIESFGDFSFMSKILKSYLITGDCSISFI